MRIGLIAFYPPLPAGEVLSLSAAKAKRKGAVLSKSPLRRFAPPPPQAGEDILPGNFN